ncbi:hypothetical protein AB3S75_015718 [Citrus x aurantiifolia]
MAHAIVSFLLDQLKSIPQDQVKEKWRLVTGLEQEVETLTKNLRAIQAVLEDAEQRQMKLDKAVTCQKNCLSRWSTPSLVGKENKRRMEDEEPQSRSCKCLKKK